MLNLIKREKLFLTVEKLKFLDGINDYVMNLEQKYADAQLINPKKIVFDH